MGLYDVVLIKKYKCQGESLLLQHFPPPYDLLFYGL